MRALAEAAAARESAEYERVIAEREHARREREAETESKHQRERAEYEKDLAILAANRKVAVANAKLKAIERAIEEKEIDIRCEIPEIPKVKSEVRTQDWVRANSVTQHPPQESKGFVSVIDRVQSYKLLGLHIYKDLTWNSHCETAYKKAVKRLYGLRVVKKAGMLTGDLVSVHCSIVRSTVEYASPAWAALPQYCLPNFRLHSPS